MIKMKKILGILLALCFVLSVTAASAAASGEDGRGHGKDFDRGHGKDFDRGHGKDFDRGHFHPGYWGHHRVGHREFFEDCGCWKTVYVVEKFFVKEYWGFD